MILLICFVGRNGSVPVRHAALRSVACDDGRLHGETGGAVREAQCAGGAECGQAYVYRLRCLEEDKKKIVKQNIQKVFKLLSWNNSYKK